MEGKKKEGGGEGEVLRARVRIQKKEAPKSIVTRKHLLGGERDLEKLLAWTQTALMM
jgi:hypothetical protein